MPTRLLILLSAAALTIGCQTAPQVPRSSSSLPNTANQPNESVRIRRADTKALPTLTQQDQDLKLTLAQAQELLNTGAPDQALQLLNGLEIGELSETTGDWLYTLTAQAHISLGNYIEAYRAITKVLGITTDYWLLLNQVCAKLTFRRCQADSMIALQAERTLSSRIDQDAILQILLDKSRTPYYEDIILAAAEITPITSPETAIHQGWYTLAEILTSAGSRQRTATVWQNWRQSWPNHPAALTPPTIIDQFRVEMPKSIALMLPLSGDLAHVGRAVRDGFIAALMAEEMNIGLHIFDSVANSSIELIRSARGVNADVIVGPLLKLNVDAFATFAAASETPTLLLNYLPKDTDATAARTPAMNLLQLGTAIEDEAATLAVHMQTNQHERVMIVSSNSVWANKALDTFREDWPHPVYTARFSTIKQLTNAVGTTMGVADSTARKTRVSSLLKEPIEFLPRARQDLDAIVALTTGFESAALIPALQFHFADHLPVYATSQSLRDNESPNGFTVTELPALVQPDATEQALINAFNLNQNPLVDLYVLGLTAFQMATWAPALTKPSPWRDHFTRQSPIGRLSLESGGRLSRSLAVTTVQDAKSSPAMGVAESK